MKKIIFFELDFIPGGKGRVALKLEGDTNTYIKEFDPVSFSVVASMLIQQQLWYDPVTTRFSTQSHRQ